MLIRQGWPVVLVYSNTHSCQCGSGAQVSSSRAETLHCHTEFSQFLLSFSQITAWFVVLPWLVWGLVRNMWFSLRQRSGVRTAPTLWICSVELSFGSQYMSVTAAQPHTLFLVMRAPWGSSLDLLKQKVHFVLAFMFPSLCEHREIHCHVPYQLLPLVWITLLE